MIVERFSDCRGVEVGKRHNIRARPRNISARLPGRVCHVARAQVFVERVSSAERHLQGWLKMESVPPPLSEDVSADMKLASEAKLVAGDKGEVTAITPPRRTSMMIHGAQRRNQLGVAPQ